MLYLLAVSVLVPVLVVDGFVVDALKGDVRSNHYLSIVSTNLGPFGANSGITVGQSSSIRWYPSIFQKPHGFPRN